MSVSHPTPTSSLKVLVLVVKHAICVLLLLAAVLVLLWPIFLPGFLVYLDNPVHLAEAYAFVENVRGGGSFLDGWSMSNSAGYPLLLYHPKIAFWLIAGLHFLLSISVVLAYKLVVFLSILLPLVGVFVLLRKDGLLLPAFFCSFLFLFQNNLVHYTLSGLGSNALATGVLFFLGATLFAFTGKPTYKNAVAAGVLLGLLTITHLYIMVGGVILWGTVLVTFLICSGREKRTRTLFLLLVPVIGFLTSYFSTHQLAQASRWLVAAGESLPLISFRTVLGNLFWKGDFFSQGEGIGRIANVLGNGAIVIAIVFAILGAGYAFDGKRKDRAFYIRVVSILLFIGFSSAVASGIIVPGVGLKGEWLGGLDFVRSTKIHGYRFMVLARAGMLYLSAYGLSRFAKDRALPSIAGMGRLSLTGKFRWPVLVPVAGLVFLAANLPFFFYHRTVGEIRRNPLFPARDSALLTTASSLQTAKDLMDVCNWLRENGDGQQRRVFFQNTLGNVLLEWREAARVSEKGMSLEVETTRDTVTHFTHLPAISPMHSGMPQIGSWIGGNLFPIERISISESGRFLGSTVEEFDDLDLVLKKRYLQRLNIHYVVTCEPRLGMRLTASRFFEHKASFGAFDIFELRDIFYTPHKPGWTCFSLPSQYIPNNSTEVKRFDNAAIDISFENYATIVALHVSVCEHPFWSASVDGKPVKIESDDIGLMRIPLEIQDEEGRGAALLGKHTLKLRYRPDRGASVPISLASFVLSVVLLLMPRFGRKKGENEKNGAAVESHPGNETSPVAESEGPPMLDNSSER